jgi:hypothetical protein
MTAQFVCPHCRAILRAYTISQKDEPATPRFIAHGPNGRMSPLCPGSHQVVTSEDLPSWHRGDARICVNKSS